MAQGKESEYTYVCALRWEGENTGVRGGETQTFQCGVGPLQDSFSHRLRMTVFLP